MPEVKPHDEKSHEEGTINTCPGCISRAVLLVRAAAGQVTMLEARDAIYDGNEDNSGAGFGTYQTENDDLEVRVTVPLTVERLRTFAASALTMCDEIERRIGPELKPTGR